MGQESWAMTHGGDQYSKKDIIIRHYCYKLFTCTVYVIHKTTIVITQMILLYEVGYSKPVTPTPSTPSILDATMNQASKSLLRYIKIFGKFTMVV